MDVLCPPGTCTDRKNNIWILLRTGEAVRRAVGQVDGARDVIQEDNHHHCDSCQAGHNVFDAVSDGGAIPLLRAEPQRGREAVGGMVSDQVRHDVAFSAEDEIRGREGEVGTRQVHVLPDGPADTLRLAPRRRRLQFNVINNKCKGS